LHPSEPGGRRRDVLEEANLTAGSQHAPRLMERARYVRDRAQHQRVDDRVNARVIGRQAVCDTGHDVDRNRRSRRTHQCGVTEAGLRLDRHDADHLRRIVREVQAVACADFEHVAGEPGEEPATMLDGARKAVELAGAGASGAER